MEFITFLHMEMPKPVWRKDLFIHWNPNCTDISQPPIPWNMWMCFQNWWINTTAPFIGVFKPPLPKSHRLRGNKYGIICKVNGRKKKKPAFEVGDKVRLNKKFRTFKKSYLPGWTEEVFEIRKVVPGFVTNYKVRELDDTPLQGTFYTWDLQKVHVDVFASGKSIKEAEG